jgi:hypothetical protein
VALTRGTEVGENRRVGDGGWSRGRAQPTWCGDDTSGMTGSPMRSSLAHVHASTRGRQQVGDRELHRRWGRVSGYGEGVLGQQG